MQIPFTLDQWRRLPEGFPAQLIDGGLVRDPAPTFGHQRLVGRLYRLLVDLVGEDRVALAPADVVIDRLNVLQPDVCVLRAAPEMDSQDVGIPLVACEILSASTRTRDRTVKATKLLAAGVDEVWLLDPELRRVELRTTGESRLLRGAQVGRSRAVAGLRFVPDELFGAS